MSREQELNTEHESIKAKVNELENILKECGAYVTECSNCGETVVIDVSDVGAF